MMRFPIARSLRRPAALAAAALLASACSTSEILEVEDIDVARPGALTGAAALPTVYFSTISDFQVAYAGSSGTEGHVNLTGVISDEFKNSETFPTRVQWDKRAMEPVNASTEGIFRNLMRAQATAELAARRYAEFGNPSSTQDQGRRAEIYAIWGWIYILAAENWCSGVPVSKLTDAGDIEYGTPQTSAELYANAIAKFDSAIVIANGATAGQRTTVAGLANTGRARVFLNLARYTDAQAAAALVPVTFRYDIQHSANTGRQWNGLWSFMPNQRRWVVADNEGGNGLPFVSSNDPRIRPRTVAGTTGFDGITPMVVADQLTADRTVPTNLARGVEAQLVIAEVQARNNDPAFLTTLNALRANTSLYACPTQLTGCVAPTALPALTDPGSTTARINLVLREKAFWLFGTSRRMGDLRRIVRVDGRDQATVFPNGTFTGLGGGTFGTDVNIPIPQPDELQNPNVTNAGGANGLCLDRRA